MNYKQASEILKEVEVEPVEKQIFIKREDSLIVLDFQTGNI